MTDQRAGLDGSPNRSPAARGVAAEDLARQALDRLIGSARNTGEGRG